MEDVRRSMRKIGLSQLESRVSYISDEPKIPYYICTPNKKAREKYICKSTFGQGHHTNETTARIKSIAEFFERLCLDNYLGEELRVSSFEEREGNFIDPALFCCYSSSQMKNREELARKLRKSKMKWKRGYDILNNSGVWVPAQMVFVQPSFENEPPIRGERISTGAAFGEKDSNRAINSGLLEAIERDACIYSYLTKRPIPRIINLPPESKKLTDYLGDYEIESYTFDATSDLEVPTAISIAIDRTGEGPAVDAGSASGFTYREAIYKSILESVQCRRSARLYEDINYPNGPPTENEIFSLEDRFTYWHNPDRIKDIGFWINTTNKVDYSKLRDFRTNYNSIIDSFEQKGYHVIDVDITLPEVRNEGFEVKKVIIPELHPMYLDERAKMLYSIHYGEIKEKTELKPHLLT